MNFIDLGLQYKKLKKEINKNVLKTMNDASFIGGPQVKQLEKELCDYVGAKHCLTCGNGTDALTLALSCIGVGDGDAVLVPDFTFFASAEVIALNGAEPIFVDIDKKTYNMSAPSLKVKIAECKEKKKNIKAMIVVDLFGLPANYKEILAIAKKNKILVIEDGAQGFGGEINGKKACSFGDIATTSFFPAKPLGCYGDGGAIFTDNDEYYKKMQSLAVHGKGSDKYDNVAIGYNSRLDTIQASILLVKLKAFRDFEFEARQKVAQTYNSFLKDQFDTPFIPEGYKSSYAQYSLLLKDSTERDNIMAKMKAAGIPTMIYYKKPMHAQKAFANIKSKESDYAVSNDVCGRVVSLPFHPYLTEKQIKFVCDNLKEAVK